MEKYKITCNQAAESNTSAINRTKSQYVACNSRTLYLEVSLWKAAGSSTSSLRVSELAETSYDLVLQAATRTRTWQGKVPVLDFSEEVRDLSWHEPLQQKDDHFSIQARTEMKIRDSLQLKVLCVPRTTRTAKSRSRRQTAGIRKAAHRGLHPRTCQGRVWL